MPAAWQATILDESGAIQPNASVQVLLESNGALAALFSDRAGTVPELNPVIADDAGFVRFYTAGGAYRITATLGAFSREWRHVAIGLLSEADSLESARISYGATATEIAAGATPTNEEYNPVPEDVRRWGALDTGGSTDSTAEIQDAVDALNAGSIRGGAVSIPGDANSVYNISDAISLPARASGDNHTRWFSVRGMGRGAPRLTAITGLANASMINATGHDSSTYSFYREFKDLYLNGGGIANRGIELSFNQHYKVENVFITSLDDGSSANSAAGVRVYGAICAQFRDVKVHNGDGYGILQYGGSANFFNANLVEGCSFLDLAADGNYYSGGVNGCVFIANTFEFCRYGQRFAGYSAGGIFIAGNYYESTEEAEVYFGEDTSLQAATFEANYLNGYTAGVSSTSYTPIRIKFGRGLRISTNVVNLAAKSATGYYLLDANISGGAVEKCIVENNIVNGLSASTAPNQVYNISQHWVNFGNSLIDQTFAPLIPANLLRGRWPYGGWSHTVGGGSSLVQRSNGINIFGAPSLLIFRDNSGNAASTTTTITASSGLAQLLNRFVTFGVPILRGGTASGTAKTFQVQVTPNGTSPQTATITDDSLTTVNQTRIVYATVFVPSDATQIVITLSVTTNNADYHVGHPCLYVGASPWYSAAGDQYWYANAAPTTGRWEVGDIVFDSVPVSGAQMGWMCTVAGSPGTWVAMANLA